MSNIKPNNGISDSNHHKLSLADKFLLTGILTSATSFVMAWVSVVGKAQLEKTVEPARMTPPIMAYKLSSVLCNSYNFIVHHAVQPISENFAQNIEIEHHKEPKALFMLGAIAMTATICNGLVQNRKKKSGIDPS